MHLVRESRFGRKGKHKQGGHNGQGRTGLHIGTFGKGFDALRQEVHEARGGYQHHGPAQQTLFHRGGCSFGITRMGCQRDPSSYGFRFLGVPISTNFCCVRVGVSSVWSWIPEIPMHVVEYCTPLYIITQNEMNAIGLQNQKFHFTSLMILHRVGHFGEKNRKSSTEAR
eukprot:scaffold143_cov154-Amphora_coffeaeformis.AAC.8